MDSNQFKNHRLCLGLTQAELAELMGMRQTGIARIESGQRQPTKKDAAVMRIIVTAHNLGMLPQLIAATKKNK